MNTTIETTAIMTGTAIEKPKNLANCTPTEFIRQTVKIKRSVKEWLDATEILEIRKTLPKGIIDITLDMTAEEKAAARENNAKKNEQQIKDNLSRMFDAVFEKEPEKTLEVLALACFVDPADIDSHPMNYYLGALNDMLNDSAVVGFFTSLVKLANTNI